MGKKRVSLREHFAQSKAGKSNDPSILGKRRPAEGTVQKNSKQPTKKNTVRSDTNGAQIPRKEKDVDPEDDDEDDDDDDDDEEEGEDENGGIRLDGNLEHVVEDFTFEFNDMREEYSEGICTMLRKNIANPTEAYNLATVITGQSE
jgi:hypothetical protein